MGDGYLDVGIKNAKTKSSEKWAWMIRNKIGNVAHIKRL